MKPLRIVLDYFGKTRLRHWPGLVFYFFGQAFFRCTGLRLFQQRLLRFEGVSGLADVGGMSGLYFLHQILVEDVYRLPALEQGPPVNMLFNVGANCGFYALTLCERRPTPRARCFEPHPATFRGLQQNIAVNRVENRVQAVQAAVGAAPG